MTDEFTDAVRRNSRLIAGIAGPTGSGKTYSALRVATGLADGGIIAFIDTERGRALDYADDFKFKHMELDEPFTPARHIEALDKAEALDPAVIIFDSGSHEHAGTGGVLDMQEDELQRLAGDDWKKRETVKFSAWVRPKLADKRYVSRLTRLRCHIIICLRAEEKVELIDDPEKPGKKKVVPKRLLSGHVGWIPVSGKTLPYELTLSLVVTPDAPGVPHAIKLPEPLKLFVPLDKPLDENVGKRLAEWAKGSTAKENGKSDLDNLAATLRSFIEDIANEDARTKSLALLGRKLKVGDTAWFEQQIRAAEDSLAKLDPEGEVELAAREGA